jgi:hypothetical protein
MTTSTAVHTFVIYPALGGNPLRAEAYISEVKKDGTTIVGLRLLGDVGFEASELVTHIAESNLGNLATDALAKWNLVTSTPPSPDLVMYKVAIHLPVELPDFRGEAEIARITQVGGEVTNVTGLGDVSFDHTEITNRVAAANLSNLAAAALVKWDAIINAPPPIEYPPPNEPVDHGNIPMDQKIP